MRLFVLMCVAAAVVGCRGSESKMAQDTSAPAAAPAPGSAAAAPAAPAAPAPISLAELAGTWNMKSMPETGDTTATSYTMKATGDTTGWTMTFPGREPVPMRVTGVSGDSVMLAAGPYSSVRRKGVMVRTETVLRKSDGHLMGNTVARYQTSGPDTVLRLRTEGMKAP